MGFRGRCSHRGCQPLRVRKRERKTAIMRVRVKARERGAANLFGCSLPPACKGEPAVHTCVHILMPQPNASDPLQSLAGEGLRALKRFEKQHQDFCSPRMFYFINLYQNYYNAGISFLHEYVLTYTGDHTYMCRYWRPRK